EIWRYVLSQVGGEARMFKLGTITDDSLGDKLRVTIVAAGFDSIESPIPGIELKNGFTGKTQLQEVVAEIPFVEEAPEMILTQELEENTATGSIDFMVDPEIIAMDNRAYTHVSYVELEDSNEWSNEETAKLQAMIKSFQGGLVKWGDLEGPAYRRSHIELWKRPSIPSNEMEQHWLK
ncbi:MAG: cell division protein FtsZ, partial [Dyadobacter sp.]